MVSYLSLLLINHRISLSSRVPITTTSSNISFCLVSIKTYHLVTSPTREKNSSDLRQSLSGHVKRSPRVSYLLIQTLVCQFAFIITTWSSFLFHSSLLNVENVNAVDKIQRLKPRYYYRYRCFEIRGRFESSDNRIVRFYVPFSHLERISNSTIISRWKLVLLLLLLTFEKTTI